MALSAIDALARLRERLAALGQVPGRTAVAVAPRIEMKAQADMTTSNGRVPPITVEASVAAVTVRAPAWFLENRVDAEGYTELAAEEAQRAIEEALR